jgi:demethylmenaquinone methyltransferase / 2-methoxy-6-polyprenyl-1,4-benzoquinol methylase
MFGRIARRYDLMNTLMTFGQDARWRSTVAQSLGSPARRVLDVGTGTGRLAEAVLREAHAQEVVGVDFTLPMLHHARPASGLFLAAADALTLPFKDSDFDAVISAFVVRNLAALDRGIAEQVRVLRPGGRLVILETTPGPTLAPLKAPYRLYFRYAVPILGKLIAGDASAYTYLPESTLRFVEPQRLASLLETNGLTDIEVRRLTLGCVAVTSARKSSPDVPRRG